MEGDGDGSGTDGSEDLTFGNLVEVLSRNWPSFDPSTFALTWTDELFWLMVDKLTENMERQKKELDEPPNQYPVATDGKKRVSDTAMLESLGGHAK